MPRARRLDLPGVAHHVVQRGNDRKPCFFVRGDRLRYLQCVARASRDHGCSIHAYVLMTNHVHLLATPAEKGAIGRMMQSIGRSYVRAVNDSMGRTGTLWEGRFKSCLVEGAQYLLTCYRYIELNPVRAGIARRPGDYEWSSYRANAMGEVNPLISPHKSYIALSEDCPTRHARYRRLVEEGVSDEQLEEIRLLTRKQRAYATQSARDEMERRTGQRASVGKPGRPRKGVGSPPAKNVL